MTIRVLFFASLRERTGKKEMALEVAAGTTASELLEQLRRDVPGMTDAGRISLAVNEEYCEPHQQIRDGDEIALIPPVSGGH